MVLNMIIDKYFIIKSYYVILTLCMVTSINATSIKRSKRELFREQVLPASGGKIPESAFRADRLSLNKLNKEGYAIPDGIMLDQRRPVRHPYPYQELPVTLKVYLTDDGRFVSIFGKSFLSNPEAIDTTYIIRSPVNVKASRLSFLHSHLTAAKQQVFKPVLAPLILPNNALFDKPIKQTPSVVMNHDARKLIAHEPYQRPRQHSGRKTKDTKASVENFNTNLFMPGVFNHSGGIFKDMRIASPSRRIIVPNNTKNLRKHVKSNNTRT